MNIYEIPSLEEVALSADFEESVESGSQIDDWDDLIA